MGGRHGRHGLVFMDFSHFERHKLMLQRLLHARFQRLRVQPQLIAYHQHGEAVLSASPLLVAHRGDSGIGRRVHVGLVAFELARHDEGQRLDVALPRQLHNARHFAAIHVAGLLRKHAEALEKRRNVEATRAETVEEYWESG